MKFVFPTVNLKRYRFPTHINDLVMDRSEAHTSEVFLVVLEPGQAPPLHKHDDTEQIFYVLEGEGLLTIGENREHYPVKVGDVVRIPLSTLHSIRPNPGHTVRYLAVDCFTSARDRKEATWDEHARAMCRERGWKYHEVVEP